MMKRALWVCHHVLMWLGIPFLLTGSALVAASDWCHDKALPDRSE